MTSQVKTVYLAWLSPGPRPGWHPVGRLDQIGGASAPLYRFRYTKGALRAKEQAGFTPADCFPRFEEVYESQVLFPLFQNRVMNSGRSDFKAYLQSLALPPESREPLPIMAVTGGRRQTDSFEVFPRIEPASGGHFEMTFFLHGIRHFGAKALSAIQSLAPDTFLPFHHEQVNAGTRNPAIRVEAPSGQPLGYTPNYLVPDFRYIQEHCLFDAQMIVERINPDSPLDSRVLVRMVGCWPDQYNAMEHEDFQVIPAHDLAVAEGRT